ncbi:hypothetical protein [Alienimonas chondri]|uniref:Uncharacterized protein n=1 Tax=Alienimonas chondri TaxID=2681879 RepID=A0ABX1VK88_9PLAN|nr:hypothetical protein [Alienimonas chondri]NNJ28132.1 hypothetical protein [Alienimonas chondri]
MPRPAALLSKALAPVALAPALLLGSLGTTIADETADPSGSLAAAFERAAATPELFADDGPAAWVAVRAPRTAAERSVIAEALSWWGEQTAKGTEQTNSPTGSPGASSPAGAPLAWWSAGDDAPAAALLSWWTDAPADDSPTDDSPAAESQAGPSEAGGVTPIAGVQTAVPTVATALAWWSPQAETEADAREPDRAAADLNEPIAGDQIAGNAGAGAEQSVCDRLNCLFPPLREIDAGLNTPTAVLAKTVRPVRSADGSCERLVPTAYRDVAPPEDAVGPCFAATGLLDGTPYDCRPRTLAMPFCFSHRPLYFEDPNLERCGISTGPLTQPIVSGAHFFGTVPLLPWWAATRPCNELVRATPYCPPCRKYDFAANYLPPPEAPGALAEGAALSAFFLLLP